jgi:DNA modification methylase
LTELEKSLLVTDLTNARTVLRNINWNFYHKSAFSPNELRPFNTRTYHWYPATFIPEIPYTLIEVLTLPNATVWDPFSGMGTTYFQALSLNRKALATEICGVAVEYMKSLFTLFNPSIDFKKIEIDVEKILGEFNATKNYTASFQGSALINRLEPWFSKQTLNQLSFLFGKEAGCESKELKSIFRICISASLKSVCSQDRGWGCVADNVLPKDNQIEDKKALVIFRKNARRLVREVSEHLKKTLPGYSALYEEMSKQQTIFHEDVRLSNGIPDNSVDLIVSSPPYPNMTDYVTSQRLSYYFLGFDLIEKKSMDDACMEIGARSRRSRKDSLEKYLEDMRKANSVISRKIKEEGYVCYVLPAFSMDNQNNKNRRQIVQKVLADMAEHDLVKEDEYERILPEKRRLHNAKWATLEREKIYLLRRA